jgi:hypothetical protein
MTRFFKWLGNLFSGHRGKCALALADISAELKQISGMLDNTVFLLRDALKKTTENLRSATEALVLAQADYERSDAIFGKIGDLAEKMAAREAALEEALVAKAKATMVETKAAEAKAAAEEAEMPSEYDKRY